MKNQAIGKLGEIWAQDFLVAQNYLIIETNFHSKFGEVDLIALDFTADELVFVEVKTRSSEKFGMPVEALTGKKRQKIIKTAFGFMENYGKDMARRWRIDVIGIQLNGKYKFKELIHLKNI